MMLHCIVSYLHEKEEMNLGKLWKRTILFIAEILSGFASWI